MRLPVEEIRDRMVEALRPGASGRVLLRAPTGSGKSTGVPPMMLESDAGEGRILVIQPRRIAARMLAEFVATRHGSKVGGLVGYAVRFDANYTERTRIIYLTDGVFQRWLRESPGLDGVQAVLFDEFHERRLASDLTLARVLDLQEGSRPDLRVVVMSATLETESLSRYLDPCTVLEAGGRLYPVEISNQPEPPPKRNRHGRMESVPVWERIAKACADEAKAARVDEGKGSAPRILAFLPGAYEIRKTQELLERSSVLRSWEVAPLYSALPPKQQWEAVSPGPVPRIVVATNVAETSITIDGIVSVVDSGLARMAVFDPRREIDTLTIRKISRAAADQRAGRAGRTGPGRCVRLWSEADHGRREAFEKPEVHRVDLAEAALYLKATGVEDLRSFRWLDAPAEDALQRAERLLETLGAIDGEGRVTATGVEMARYPLHPRAARLLEAAGEEGCVPEACFVAAALQTGGGFVKAASRQQRTRFQLDGDRSDFEAEWRACEAAASARFDPAPCRSLGIHARQCRETMQAWKQLCGLAGRPESKTSHLDMEAQRLPLGRAILAAYGDHVAVRLSEGTLACRVSGGRRGKLDEASAARKGRLLAAAEMTEVEGRELIVHLRQAVLIEEDWLPEFFPGELHEEGDAVFDDVARRVMARRRRVFRDLVLEDREGGEVSDEQSASLLARKVLDGSLTLKKWDASVERWIARVGFLAETMPELELDPIGDGEKRVLLEQVCAGARSYREIKEREVWPALREWLSAPQAAALESYAPERIRLDNGVETKVRYEAGAPPTIALKVQKLYGVKETPRLGGRPVRVQILGPNQRPWQVTQDLGSFWESGYPQMKKDLAGRYPKHEWK